jgi:membrane protease YdiL (CAAX protease family)
MDAESSPPDPPSDAPTEPSPVPPPPAPFDAASPTTAERLVAAFEVLLCSDYPTQFALAATFMALGFRAQSADGALNVRFVAALTLADTVFLVTLMVAFLRAHGESPREVFLGRRPILGELRAGVPMTFVVFAMAAAVMLTVRALAPWLRTVEHNPLEDLMRTPVDTALFAAVVIVGGGVREELQRAFLLVRFERWLGGPTVGIVVASVGFGFGHVVQGADAVVATALLGAFWAVTYLRRRSVVAPMVSHAGFDLLQVVQFLVLGR